MNTLHRLLAAVTLLFGTTAAMAEDLNGIDIGLARIPLYSPDAEQGYYPELLRTLNALDADIDMRVQVLPYPRSIAHLTQGQTQVHYPVAYNPGNPTPPPAGTRYSSFSTHDVAYALFQPKDSPPLDIHQLDNAVVKVVQAHKRLFPQPGIEVTSCLECGLRNVAARRSAGFIFEALVGNMLIDKLGLNTQLHGRVVVREEVRFLLPDTEAGEALDRYLATLVEQLRQSGEHTRILGDVQRQYDIMTLSMKN